MSFVTKIVHGSPGFIKLVSSSEVHNKTNDSKNRLKSDHNYKIFLWRDDVAVKISFILFSNNKDIKVCE